MKYYDSCSIAEWRRLHWAAIRYWANPTEDTSVFNGLSHATDVLISRGILPQIGAHTGLEDEDEG